MTRSEGRRREYIPGLTGLVLTYNGERWLGRCLASLALCEHVLVVDSQSTDATREIAKEAGAEVLVNPWDGPGPQFAFALDYIARAGGTNWVLSLDQDEWLSDELAASVGSVLEAPSPDLAGCYCPRRSFYYDRYMRHSGWYPDLLFRLFRPEATELRVSPPHYGFHPKGKTTRLTGDIVHHPYENLAEHLTKINRYTQEAAEDLRAKGERGGLGPALLHGGSRFLKQYVLKQGFRDGRAGLLLALHAFLYGFHKYARAAEPVVDPHKNPKEWTK